MVNNEKKFTLGEIEELCSKFQEVKNTYEQRNVEKHKNILYLANGDCICYKITKESLPHLLGVNTEAICKSNLYRTTNSIQLFENAIEDPYQIYKKTNETGMDLFSKHSFEKLENIEDIFKLNINNQCFACKFDSSKTYGFTEKKYNIDYILVFKKDDGKYMVLDFIKQDELRNNYVIKSNKIYNTKAEMLNDLDELFKFQNITFISGISTKNTDNREITNQYYLYPTNKKNIMSNVLYYLNELNNSTLDVHYDYYKLLDFFLKKNTYNYESNNILENILRLMEKHVVIEPYMLEVNSFDEIPDHKEIIDIYNDLLTSNFKDNDKASESYSKMQTKNKILEDENAELLERLRILEEENILLKDQNNKYKDENEQYRKTIDNITDSLKTYL